MKLSISLNFRLVKQYFDCIDDSGNCFIIYHADLNCFLLRIYYSELIFCDSNNITSGKSSLIKTINPVPEELLAYVNNALQVSGTWRRIGNSLPSYLLRESANKELIWNCHHPKAETEINFKGIIFRGYGYAETLLLTIKPVNLPMNVLRWGRFLSDVYSLIWISWKGSNPLNKLYCNGVEYNDVQYGEESLTFDGERYQLTFKEKIIIRKGKLSSFFSDVPWIKILFNSSVLNTTENKYKAKSVLMHDQKLTATGWSLYEIVTWKR